MVKVLVVGTNLCVNNLWRLVIMNIILSTNWVIVMVMFRFWGLINILFFFFSVFLFD